MRPRDFLFRFLFLGAALVLIYCCALAVYLLHGLKLMGM